MNDLDTTVRARGFWLWAGIVLFLATVAFLVELRGEEVPNPILPAAERPSSAGDASRVRSYAELRAAPYRAQDNLYLAAPEMLRARLPKATEPVVGTAEERRATLSRRAGRRAFDGAPPVIPHAVDQRTVPNCLACHAEGLVVGDKIARVMSHPRYDSCTQCHVASEAPAPAAAPLANLSNENSFAPLAFGGKGSRYGGYGPPTVPHSTWMRQNCSSCHGVAGDLGIRVPHPERQNCQQCHAPSAARDQRVFEQLATLPPNTQVPP